MVYKNLLSFFVILFCFPLVFGAMPVFDSFDAPLSVDEGSNFDVDYSVLGNSLTEVDLYLRSASVSKLQDGVCSGNSCSGTFTLSFDSPGEYHLVLVARDSAGSRKLESIFVTVNDVTFEYYCDSDNDGYYSSTLSGSCDNVGCVPIGCVDSVGNDCDDSNDSINPGASEVCNGVDDNCDLVVDENPDALCDDGLFCNGQETCSSGVCVSGVSVDCSSNDLVSVSTCTYSPDDNPFTFDFFAGFTSSCDEGSDSCTSSSFLLSHTCNVTCGAECVADLDCSGTVDCDSNDGCYLGSYRDYSIAVSECVDCSCTTPACDNYVESGTDFDNDNYDAECGDSVDDDATVYPGATELCDSKDNDLDTFIDEDFPTLGDSCSVGLGECQASGNIVCSGDLLGVTCDAVAGSSSEEICDGLDNDCDGSVDEDLSTPFATLTEGVCFDAVKECGGVSGWQDPDYGSDYEVVESSCDGLDNDCDGDVDEGLTTRYYLDVDGDGYGDALSFVDSCGVPAGYVLDNTDCDDSDGSIYQLVNYYIDSDSDGYDAGSEDVCSGVSAPAGYSSSTNGADCDDSVFDCNADCSSVLYFDFDSDGYGNLSVEHRVCDALGDYVLDNTDCDDSNVSINPLAIDVNDHIDNNCNGEVDENNDVPTVSLISDFNFDENYFYTLDLSTYFSDSDSLSYSYLSNSSNLSVLINGNLANVSASEYGSYNLNFSAYDNFGGNVTSNNILVTVNRVNLGLPIVENITFNETVYTDTIFSFDFDYFDLDGDALNSFEYEVYMNGTLIGTGTNSVVDDYLSWAKNDNVTVSVRGCDWSGCGEWVNKSVIVEDSLPVLTILNFSSSSTPSGDDPVYYCNFSVSADADGDNYFPITYFYWNDLISYNITRNSDNIEQIFSEIHNFSNSYSYSVLEVNSNVSCRVVLYDADINVIDNQSVDVIIQNDAPEIQTVTLRRAFDTEHNVVRNVSTNATFANTKTIDVIDYVGANYLDIFYSTNENDATINESGSRWFQDTNVEIVLWNGSLVGTDEVTFPDEVGNYTFYINVSDEFGAYDLVTVNVDLRDYAVELPTLICNDMNISDGWENVGAFACTCSNNYLGYLNSNENRTIKLSNMGDYLDSFNMSVDLLNVYDYDLTLLSESTPFDLVSAKTYQWFPLWANTNKTYTFDVTCTNEVGSVSQEVVINVSEGDYDFWDSNWFALDRENVTGLGINSTVYVTSNVTICTSFETWDDVLVMKKLFDTDDLSLIIYNTQPRWNETSIIKNAEVSNTSNLNLLGINISELVKNYNNLSVDEQYCVNGNRNQWNEEWHFNCTEENYNEGQCINGYTTNYQAVIKKIK